MSSAGFELRSPFSKRTSDYAHDLAPNDPTLRRRQLQLTLTANGSHVLQVLFRFASARA